MLAWELLLPDKHGWEADQYERLRKQGAWPKRVRPPMLLPRNDRAYCVLQRLFLITERDGSSGLWRLNYPALRDFMIEFEATAIDREKIFTVWAALRGRQAERIEKRGGRSGGVDQGPEWNEKKSRFLSA